jgi:hypothetical protein
LIETLQAAHQTLIEAAAYSGIHDAENDIYFERYLLSRYYSSLADELKRSGFELPKDWNEKFDLLRRVKEALLARIGEIPDIGVGALARAAGEALVARLDHMIAELEANG